MSAVLRPVTVAQAAGPRGWPGHVLHSWRSLRLSELGWFLWIGGLISGMNLLAMVDGYAGQQKGVLLLSQALSPVASMLLLLLIWLPADRSAIDHRLRTLRLAFAVMLASALSAVLGPLLIQALGLPSMIEVAYSAKGKASPGAVASLTAEFISMLIPSTLSVAVIEMSRRHLLSRQALDSAQHELAALARSALESRLAAMQAQVEPQFLFDVLVDIERLYALPAGATCEGTAAQQMDRLITYLRVALPRLRESGSTLGTEVDLLSSYLDLVRALRGGLPEWRVDLPDALRGATFHPMLLLPLVQRAVRSDGPTPRRIRLRAERSAGELRLVLDLAAPDLCRDDPELQRLRERLQVLYVGRASLHCDERRSTEARPGAVGGAPEQLTRFTLTLPDADRSTSRVVSRPLPSDGPRTLP